MADAEKARAEARVILDKFAKEIGKVKTSEIFLKGEDSGVREELGGVKCDTNFRTTMLKNAPKSDEECLIVEKGSWI